MDELADASQEEEQLFPNVAFTFHSWMTDTLSMKEGTTKNYCNQLRLLFEEDGKSFPCMASPEYFTMVRNSPVNRRGNNQRSACVKKFMEFWSAKGGKLWNEKGGWVQAPPNLHTLKGPIGTGRSDGEGTSGSSLPRPAQGHGGGAPAALAPSQSADKSSPGKESLDVAASRSATEPAATLSGAGGGGGSSSSSHKPPPPAAKPSEWSDASPEDRKDLPDLLVRFRRWIETRKSDEVASATAKSFGDLFKKHNAPLAVMGSSEFVRWLKSPSKAKPGQMGLKSAMWFGHFWVEGLGRKLEGTLCEVPDLRPGAAAQAPPAVGAATEPRQGGKRRLGDGLTERGAKRRRELEELLAQPEEDPPAVESDTEYAGGDVERFAKVCIVEASGSPKIDGPYRRYRGLSRGRPCYSKVLEHGRLFFYWSKGVWRIGKIFGGTSCMAKVKDIDGTDVVFPSGPYPHVWKVFQNSGDGPDADGKKSARPVPLMRVFDSAAEDELRGRSPLARLPALREPSESLAKVQAAAPAAAESRGAAAAPPGAHAGQQAPADCDGGEPQRSVEGGSSSSSQDSDDDSSGSSSDSGHEGPAAAGGTTAGSSAPSGAAPERPAPAATGGAACEARAGGGSGAEADFQKVLEGNLRKSSARRTPTNARS
ncbi:unnamed protein product [Prorocentrum cordatum]|uniref:Uncharacterized protein n=1 Tax=Prorocentrum cordatum TaxID=2364126 RepID=A0ABN9UH52_9DINO|nr:unnamed protein product [Polarella glacialis]